jgi:2-amino-4-hydroxy-6-hydroxymethyldihydropteridine diphosphokinase
MIRQPWFINAVAEIRALLEPRRLLQALQERERDMGRTRTGDGGPRIIDLDILFYGQAVIDEDDLVIPHRELHRRRFVLEPLAEIASWVIHPRFGISVRGLLDRLEDAATVVKLEG